MKKLTIHQRFYRKNKDKRKKESLTYSKKTNYKAQRRCNKAWCLRMKTAVFELLGTECKKCGFSDIRALQIDHINGGGGKEYKSIKGNYYKFLLTDIVENPKKYQVLCANCNWIKRSTNNENRK